DGRARAPGAGHRRHGDSAGDRLRQGRRAPPVHARVPQRRERAVERDLPQAGVRAPRPLRGRVPEGPPHGVQRLAGRPARLRVFRQRSAVEQAVAMTIALDHILVPTRDKNAAARFFAETLGLEDLGLGSTSGYPAFARVRVGATTLDFADAKAPTPQHLAFAVTDEELDAVIERVKAMGLRYYADPGHEHAGRT